jgi:hypothetical protein
VDDYCLREVSDLVTGEATIPLLSPDYLRLLEKCIGREARKRKLTIGAVLAVFNRNQTTVLVKYQSTQTESKPLKESGELETMEQVICHCLHELPRPASLQDFRIKAFRNDRFLTSRRGSGDDDPIGTIPLGGGGPGGGTLIVKCRS